ncbi:MAG: SIR2 family NAD-dependent protein deacylase [Saprospiraceae bacterium]
MRKIVILTGAGISAESGISTFRDAGGLWEQYDIMEVASIDGWYKNKALVLEFYNQRRRQLFSVEPNAGHRALVALEQKFEVSIITQNVDDLHERAGSSKVMHLHGELRKARSTEDEFLIYDWDKDIQIGDVCELGSQLRPHIVWFGEVVPMITIAAAEVMKADILLIIGTSLQVYPAAGLAGYAPEHARIYYIDPHPGITSNNHNFIILPEKATTGVPKVVQELLNKSDT